MKNIIVIDMQKGFINKNNIHLVEKINEYLNNNNFDNVFFTKCVNSPESPFMNILNWNGVNNEQEQEIVVNVPKNAKILIKHGYGIGGQVQQIKNLGVNEIEICGTDTDACCMAIAFDLFDCNIKPIILSDLCASSSSDLNIHNNALEIMKRQFGKDNIK